MHTPSSRTIFDQRILDEIFPSSRADRFFAALLGDASEGAYDITLAFAGETDDQIDFEFQLKQRPGKRLTVPAEKNSRRTSKKPVRNSNPCS